MALKPFPCLSSDNAIASAVSRTMVNTQKASDVPMACINSTRANPRYSLIITFMYLNMKNNTNNE